ncbi:hypothetical protein CDAR_308171, partial [Caerostris darwini]
DFNYCQLESALVWFPSGDKRNAFPTFSIAASLTCEAVLKLVEDPAATLFLTESTFVLYTIPSVASFTE